MKEEILNPNEYSAVVGERLELHFNITSIPLISAAQRKLILIRLSSIPQVKIEKVETHNRELIIQVYVAENPFPLVLLIGGVITVLSGFFIWGSLGKVYKIMEQPAGSILMPIILGALVLGFIKFMGVR
ncbi:hypothetical protein ES702_05958 [subsurface metagenome]